jgi:hypothetical protein
VFKGVLINWYRVQASYSIRSRVRNLVPTLFMYKPFWIHVESLHVLTSLHVTPEEGVAVYVWIVQPFWYRLLLALASAQNLAVSRYVDRNHPRLHILPIVFIPGNHIGIQGFSNFDNILSEEAKLVLQKRLIIWNIDVVVLFALQVNGMYQLLKLELVGNITPR